MHFSINNNNPFFIRQERHFSLLLKTIVHILLQQKNFYMFMTLLAIPKSKKKVSYGLVFLNRHIF